MFLTFTNADLARLCNEHAELAAFAGRDASALEQLLNELDCADTLGHFEELPHVLLLRAPKGRVAARNTCDAGVLLQPKLESPKSYRAAEAAIVVAVAVGADECNPEGAPWHRASATSRTMR